MLHFECLFHLPIFRTYQAEIGSGNEPVLKNLAKNIIKSQAKEIEEMRQWLNKQHWISNFYDVKPVDIFACLKLTTVFLHDDLKGMIKEKMSGQDPTYRFESQKFSLYELD